MAANNELCRALQGSSTVILPAPELSGPWTKPVLALPVADAVADPDTELELELELESPRWPFVPGPAPDTPGIVLAELVCDEPAETDDPFSGSVPVARKDPRMTWSFTSETVLLVARSLV